tara:strand:+ start:5005 stop:5721 length:717 start_codon:yes stop_codon:yes gene_type:complete
MKPEDFKKKIEAFEVDLEDSLGGALPGDDFDWYSFVRKFKFSLNKKILRPEAKEWLSDSDNEHDVVIAKQYPQELAMYLKWVFDNILDIRSYFELGVERGGTYIAVSTLLKIAHGEDNIRCASLDIHPTEFVTKYADLKSFSTQYTADSAKWDFPEKESWDLIFLDGMHTYDYVKNDYDKAKHKCRYLGFHDINLQGYAGGVPKLWNEVKGEHKVIAEFHNSDPIFSNYTVGAGILEI